jgi:hypothetical protein
MRRISLAVALVGAVAVAGCGGGAKPSSSGGTKGTAGSTFTVTVRAEGTGTVTSVPAGISCPGTCAADFAYGTAVQLTATTTQFFNGWFGDCNGTGVCSVSGNANKYVVSYFSATPQAHPTFNDGKLHGPAYNAFVSQAAGALQCTQCHGAQLQGVGVAVSCAGCHLNPFPNQLVAGKHFEASGHNSGTCARCHAGDGFKDFIGVDGTASAVTTVGYTSTALAATDKTVACSATVTTNCLNSGMKCDMCHSPSTGALYTVTQKKFPSGALVTITDGPTALCAQCHDGGRPGYEVSQLAVQIKSVTVDAQLPSADNKVVRAHFLPAASTLFGADAANWYQYTGNIYTAKNQHGGKGGCTDCHDAHSGALPADAQIAAKCGVCHFNETTGLPVATFAELEEARQFGFEGDIDGNGAHESLKVELNGLGAKLYAAIQAYATRVGGASICAIDNRYYVQANTTDACGAGANNVAYNKFTPRLLRAAYNYLAWQNDVGAWAHNPRYIVEVLYDTIADLNVGLGANFVLNGKRAFNGHFGAAEDPSPYAAMIYHGAANALTGEVLPAMGFTSGACYQCHGGQGGVGAYLAAMPTALTNSVITAANKVSAMQCSVCHVDRADMKGIRDDIGTVYFPPQKNASQTPTQNVVSYAAADLPKSFALCGTCHSGRENGTTITNAIGSLGDTSFTLGFKNPHYLGAAAMILGTEAKALYEYSGQTYAGKTVFWKTGTNGNAPGPYGSAHGAECTGCHQPKASKHSFEVDFTYCATCHNLSSHGDHRLAPIEEEYQVRSAELYAAIQAYAVANAAGTGVAGVCYNGNANPYFFNMLSGVCQDGVANAPAASAAFAKFNPKLLKAAYNYQWTQKEPGAWAHNEVYVTEAIFDSIVDLGGTPTFTRP